MNFDRKPSKMKIEKMNIRKRFTGKVALVTASTQGIGFCIAERIGLEGASVMISSWKQKTRNIYMVGTRVANAYFSLFMAVGNVLGYATGAFSYWFKVFPFTLTSACDVNCANLKSAFLIDIAFIALTTYLSISAAQELPLSSSDRNTPFAEEGPGQSSEAEESFLWELFGTFRYFSGSLWIILLVTGLNWIGWFPFLLFDTDWMGREIYGGKPNEGINYSDGVRMGALSLMLNSIMLGITPRAVLRFYLNQGGREFFSRA